MLKSPLIPLCKRGRKRVFPLPFLKEELNTIESYTCSSAQKSANTNWLAIHFYWHEFIGSRDV